MATTKQYTIADIEVLDDDGYRHELIEGELLRMPPTGEEHGFYGGDIIGELIVHVRRNKLGRVSLAETGFIIARDPDTLLAPDGAFVRAERMPDQLGSGFSNLTPDLVIEVTSPSDRRTMIERKIAIWLGAGVRVVWQVDPARRTVTVYQPGQEPLIIDRDGELDGGDVVPGFRLMLSEIFP